VNDFKTVMTQHLNKSHNGDYVFSVQIPLADFEDFLISRVRDPEVVATLETVMHNKGFWKAIRFHPTLQNIPFSGLGDGEFKPF
jgi:hypothetical protein